MAHTSGVICSASLGMAWRAIWRQAKQHGAMPGTYLGGGARFAPAPTARPDRHCCTPPTSPNYLPALRISPANSAHGRPPVVQLGTAQQVPTMRSCLLVAALLAFSIGADAKMQYTSRQEYAKINEFEVRAGRVGRHAAIRMQRRGRLAANRRTQGRYSSLCAAGGRCPGRRRRWQAPPPAGRQQVGLPLPLTSTPTTPAKQSAWHSIRRAAFRIQGGPEARAPPSGPQPRSRWQCLHTSRKLPASQKLEERRE